MSATRNTEALSGPLCLLSGARRVPCGKGRLCVKLLLTGTEPEQSEQVTSVQRGIRHRVNLGDVTAEPFGGVGRAPAQSVAHAARILSALRLCIRLSSRVTRMGSFAPARRAAAALSRSWSQSG